MSDFETAFEEAYEKGKTRKTGGDGKNYVIVPDGDHTSIFKGVELDTSGDTPVAKPKFYFPEFNQTETIFLRNNPFGGKVLGSMLAGLEIKVAQPTFETAVSALNGASGWTIKVRKKTKKEPYVKPDGARVYDRSYYVNGVVARTQTTIAPAPAIDGTDIPF